MAWLAVDKDGSEYIYKYEPERDRDEGQFNCNAFDYIPLPTGSIAKLLGRALTWNDDPVELK